ncbi:MAG TPA: FHA domain-containing protein, partial [Dehalococcoidia bacterium]|nr:FHA domain-containing protein [Dehalococcoidia bacterium]
MLRFRIEGSGGSREQTVAGDEASLGRAPGNDIVLPDESVSRHHARLVARGGAIHLEDLGGTNGTQLNGHLLHGESVQILPGEAFVIGEYRIAVYALGRQLAGTVAAHPDGSSPSPAAPVDLRQTAAAAPGTSRQPAPAGPRPELLIEADGNRFSYVMQRDAATIGRAPGNDIVLSVPTLSTNHAIICWQQGGWSVLDQRSRNGTFVNGRRVDSAPLHDGDRIVLGDEVTATFRLPAAAALRERRPRTHGLVEHGPGPVRIAIGRSPQNQLVLDSPLVSRQHALLERPDEAAPWSITDLGSMNRTYVNGAAVTRQQLAEGDVVRIGPFRLTLRHGE